MSRWRGAYLHPDSGAGRVAPPRRGVGRRCLELQDREPMPDVSKCILVLPSWCATHRTGGGQRTGIFYSALQQFGPVEVVVYGHRLDRVAIEPVFPGRAGLHLVETLRVPHRLLGRFGMLADRFRRYVWFSREYRPEPALRAQILALIEPAGHVIVLHRYFPSFCLAGHRPADRVRMFAYVDIDDREDHRLLLIFREAFGERLARLYQTLVLPRLRALMRRRLAVADCIWFAAEEDLAGFSGLPVHAVPNVPFAQPESEALPPPSDLHDVLFVGTYSFPPNADAMRWFLRHCWPVLHSRHPESRLRIVGFGDWPSMAAEFPGLEGVDYVGAVDSVAPEYARARLVVSPIFVGGGSKIKLIEACAHGRPAVVSEHSARGFGAEIYAALPRADTAEAFIALCDRFLTDAAAADALGARLRALQQARFSRDAVEARIASDIRDTLADRAGKAPLVSTAAAAG